MQALIVIQLDFEAFKHRTENNPKLFPSKSIACALKSIEDYLGDVIGDYEAQFLFFSGQPPMRPLAFLRNLQEFIGPFKSHGPFDERFKKPFHMVVAELQNLIIQ
ncbi:hypothetical protein DIE07_14370 [Burkholderia sp. Bp9002]|nr:hypothetical protein DIE07_14370 [Burkholderia sp. Bp9002]